MRSFSRSHHAVIRVYDEAGNVIQASRTQARIKQSAHFSLARARQKKARKDLKIAVNVLTKSDRNRYTSPGMRGLVRIQVIGAAAAILFARSVVADDWPYYQHDVWHTGDSSGFVNPQALSLTWTAPSSPTGYSTPVIIGNNIYAMQNQQGIGGSHTTVSSFDLSTGTINWSYTGEFVFPSQPGVGGWFVTFLIKRLARRTTSGRAGFLAAEAAPLPTMQRASSCTCSKIITTQLRRSRLTTTLIMLTLCCCGNAPAKALAVVARWPSAQPV